MPTLLLKRAAKGALPVIAAAKAVQDELVSIAPAADGDGDEPLAAERRTVAAMRKTALAAVGLAAATYGDRLAQEQEALMLVSDIVMETFGADSATRRAAQAAAGAHPTAALQADAAAVFTHDAALRVEASARTLFASMLSGDAQRTSLAGLRRILESAAGEYDRTSPPHRRCHRRTKGIRVRMTRWRIFSGVARDRRRVHLRSAAAAGRRAAVRTDGPERRALKKTRPSGPATPRRFRPRRGRASRDCPISRSIRRTRFPRCSPKIRRPRESSSSCRRRRPSCGA